MKKNEWPIWQSRAWLGALLFVASLLMSGCAGMRAYHEGNDLLGQGKINQGLAKLEEAVRLEPRNAEYRIALASRRLSIINQLIDNAEAARREGRLSDAEKSLRQVQTIEPDNAMARQGIEMLNRDRRHQALIAQADELLKKGSPADLQEAMEKIRPVLSENPGYKPALYLKARIEEQRSKDSKSDIKLADTFRKPISLEFREAPLRLVMEVIAKVSGLNFFYDKDIRPDLKATVFAKNTTIEDALRLLLVTNQLEMKVLNENTILIYPNTQQKVSDYQTLVVKSFYVTNADVKNVGNMIKTIVKTKDVVVDERLGLIVMRDTPEAIRMAERLVSLHDLTDPEVMLDVEIMEIKRSRLLELGIQWPSQLTLSPLQMGGVPLTLQDLRHLNESTTQAAIGNVVINARKENQTGNILANPRIRVRNREKAKVQIGDRVPVITTTSTSTGFVSESVSYVDVGLKLEVEPTIYLDDEVAIKVGLEVSNLVREVLSKSGSLSYQIGTRGANTVLRLKDGETQILAGLISDEDRSSANKVPLLGDLPIAGRLFGSQKDDTQRSEILLSITPRIVRSIQRPNIEDSEFESGTEANIGKDSLKLSTVDVSEKRSPESNPNPAAPVARPLSVSGVGQGGASLSNAGQTGTMTLTWEGPTQVRVGEQFSAVVRINSPQPIKGMPLMLSYDPSAFQVVSASEGDYFKQGGATTNFSQRVDMAQGKVFVGLVRQGVNPQDSGINGVGSLVTITMKAIKPTAESRIQVLSATPEPASQMPAALPIDLPIRVLP